MDEIKLVKLYTTQDNLQAEMILEVLKKEKIPALKQDTNPGCFLNIYAGNSRFGEDIFVAEKDFDRAAEVLEGIGIQLSL